MSPQKSKLSIVDLSLKYPGRCLLLTCLLSLVCVLLSFEIESNTTPYFLDRFHAERIKEDKMTDTFLRSKETIAVLLRSEQSTAFSDEALSIVENIEQALYELDLIELLPTHDAEILATQDEPKQIKEKPISVRDKLIQRYNQALQDTTTSQERMTLQRSLGQYIHPINHVKSIHNSDDIYMEEDDIVIAPRFDHAALDNNLFVNSLASEDGKALAMHLELNVDPDNSKATKAIFEKIHSTFESLIEGSPFQAYYSGSPVVNVEISNIMEKDNERYFPMIVVLISLILSFLYRSIWAPLLALSVSVFTIIITFGLMSMLGITLNIVTTILPIFIITIGVTDAIHVLSNTESNYHEDQERVLKRKVYTLFKAMLLTSLTTALGFFSLSYTEITNIHDFGIMVGIGTLIAFLLSVTTLPALIKKCSYTLRSTKAQIPLFSFLEEKATQQNTKRFVVLLTAMLLISSVGLSLFYVDQQNLASFERDTLIRQHDDVIKSSLGGTVPVSIWIRSEQARGILDPQVLSTIEAFETIARQHEVSGYTLSLNGFLREIHQALNEEDSHTLTDKSDNSEKSESNAAPVSSLPTELIAQYLFLLEGGPSRDLESVLKIGTYDETRVVIMCNSDGSQAIQALLDELEAAAKNLPSHARFDFAGYGSMNAVAAKEIVHGQLSSIIISVVGLLILLSVIYRSIAVGAIALFPLTMSLLVMFGLMGYTRIPLDIGSSLLCGVAFGIGIDYSIHIIEAYKRAINRIECHRDALAAALREVCFPILTSAFTIALGFSILMLSDFKPIFNLGFLISLTMLVSALCALFIIPHMLQFAHKSLVKTP